MLYTNLVAAVVIVCASSVKSVLFPLISYTLISAQDTYYIQIELVKMATSWTFFRMVLAPSLFIPDTGQILNENMHGTEC